MLAQPQNMATVNVSLEPKQNCPKKHKCVFSPLASNLKKHRRVFLLYCRFQTKHKCVSCLFWEMQWKTHMRFFFRLSNDQKKYTKKKKRKKHIPDIGVPNNLAQILRESSPLLHGSSGYISSWLPCSSISHVEKKKKQNATAHTKPWHWAYTCKEQQIPLKNTNLW